jgi:hypothetical protein
MHSLLQHYDTLVQVIRLPVARLAFHRHIDPVNITSTYRNYTRPHPRYKVFRNKTLGAALIDLRAVDTRDKYLDLIKGKNNGAWHAKRARSRGYVVAEIDRNAHIDDIHHINTSEECRQGRPMEQHYTEKVMHFDTLKHFRYYGVLNGDGKLMAYGTIGMYGNFGGFSQLIGVRNNDGIMHLLVSDIVGRLIDDGLVSYVMYDTFFGALPGLRQFKTILGFQPYRARYSLQ